MTNKKKKSIKKVTVLLIIILSFFLVILIGGILLSLPIFHQKDQGMNFVDAFFTSTSAVCVTGLCPVTDVGACLNLGGRIILALLIEFGGLGSVTIITFIAIVLGFKINYSQRVLLRESLNQDSLEGIVSLVKKIVFVSLIIQSIGAILLTVDLYFIWDYSFVDSLGYGVFQSISAFNNCGFDLFGSTSLIQFAADPLFNISTALLIIFGGIGFIVIFDLINKRFNFRKLNVHSKIVLTMTLFLLTFGTLVYKLSNFNDFTWLESFFLSVTTRTAGFTTIDLKARLTDAMVLFSIFLMFVGASPASTGGGVKTTTFFTMLASLKSFAFGESQVHAFRRKISMGQIVKSFILTTVSIVFCLTITFVVLAIEHNEYSLGEILFETVSAFGTVGLSLSVTPNLTAASKLVLCLTMFVGRLGPTTFISLFNNRFVEASTDELRYIEENVIIG